MEIMVKTFSEEIIWFDMPYCIESVLLDKLKSALNELIDLHPESFILEKRCDWYVTKYSKKYICYINATKKFLEDLGLSGSFDVFCSKLNEIGTAALISASIRGHLDIFTFLIETGVQYPRNTYDSSPLVLAAINNNLNIVKYCLDNVLSESDKYSSISIALASKYGNIEIVKILIDKGIPLDDGDGVSSGLFNACEEGFVNIVSLLLDHGAESRHDEYGQTPLGIACRNGRTEIVEILLKHKFKQTKDWSGNTPLFLATANNFSIICMMLMKDNIGNHSANNNNFTPLSFAIKGSNEKMVKLLIKCGAPVKNDASGLNLIKYSKKFGNANITEMLKEKSSYVQKIRNVFGI